MNTLEKKELKYHIKGIDCIGCVKKIESYCKSIKGIQKAEVDFTNGVLLVTFQQHTAETKHKLASGLFKLGYEITEALSAQESSTLVTLNKNFQRKKLFKALPRNFPQVRNSPKFPSQLNRFRFPEFSSWSWIILFVTLYSVLFFVQRLFAYELKSIFSIFTVFLLLPIVRKAYLMAKAKYIFSVEMLMSISAFGAILIGASEEAAAVLILYLIGEKLESYSTEKAKKELHTLTKILPEYATRINQNGTKEIILTENIRPYDVLEIKPGDRFPVDGIITMGQGYIDESLLTGEVKPIWRGLNQTVIAGANNSESFLQIKAQTSGRDNTVTRLLKLISSAHASKTKTMRNIEKFSQIYTPIVLALGVLTALIPPLFFAEPWPVWIYRALALLLIGCPCALIISTPSAISAGIAKASKLGILIKQAAAIEIVGKIQRIAFDKTGTLTFGKLTITHCAPTKETEQTELMRIAASIEAQSNHPIALAMNHYAEQLKLDLYPATETKNLPGIGIQGKIKEELVLLCSPQYAMLNNKISENHIADVKLLQQQGNSIVCVIKNDKFLGHIALNDILKPEAHKTIQDLNSLNIKTIILTGDNQLAANYIASELKISVKAELLPQDKLNYIQTAAKKHIIAMVGDGINDGPALAAANIGIAMGSGTNIAIDTSQIIITSSKLSKLIDAIVLSKKVMQKIYQNIVIALSLKIIFTVLILSGNSQLWMAILADTGATLIVTLNSLAILMFKPKQYS